MSTAKKIGYFFIALIPGVVFIVIQTIVVIVGYIAIIMSSIDNVMNSYSDVMSPQFISGITNSAMQYMTEMNVAYQVVAIITFGIWYFVAFGRKEKREPVYEKPTVLKIIIILLMAVFVQFGVTNILNITEALFPSLFETYDQLMNLIGVQEPTILTLLSVAILAPIVEELCFRGLTLRLFKKAIDKFWIVNILQALLFGIIHMNLVQGSYAFVIGLILGYLYEKYHSVFICMLFHFGINGSAFLVDIFMGKIPDNMIEVAVISLAAGATILVAVCLVVLGKIKRPDVGRIQ